MQLYDKLLSTRKLKIFMGNIPHNMHPFLLGEHYLINTKYFVKFIKVTPKGFNLLNLDTSKCLLYGHMYSRIYSGKIIPQDEIKFVVTIPNWISEISHIKIQATA